MKLQDIFALILRCVAVYLIIWGLWNFASFLVQVGVRFLNVVTSSSHETSDIISVFYDFAYGCGAPILGFVILLNADGIARWCYQSKETPPPLPDSKKEAALPPVLLK